MLGFNYCAEFWEADHSGRENEERRIVTSMRMIKLILTMLVCFTMLWTTQHFLSRVRRINVEMNSLAPYVTPSSNLALVENFSRFLYFI